MATKLVPNKSNDDRSGDYVPGDVGSESATGELSENVRVTGERSEKPLESPKFDGSEKPEDRYNGP